ncbi:hypothetical protein JCM15124A_02440 [Prevotella falsenii]
MQADEVKILEENTFSLAISPNGKYLVGYNPTKVKSEVGTESFLYDVSSGSLKWVTTDNSENWETYGMFRDVNDAGTLCGSVKDLNHYVDFYGTNAPTNVAAIFENGKIVKLPYGELDMNKIKQHEDGTFAASLSNDGKVVAGYCKCSNFAFSYPCKWTRGANNEWKMEILPLPEGYEYGLAVNVSADGRTITGLAVDKGKSIVCYWIDGKCKTVNYKDEDAELAKMKQMRMIDMSHNGKYFIFSFSSRSDYRIFDVEKGTYRTLSTFDSKEQIRIPTVADNGDVFGAVIYDAEGVGGMYYRNFWYQYSSGRIFDFTYYLYLFNPQLNVSFPLNYEDGAQAFPAAVSANGNVITGNKDTNTALGQTPKAWVLNVNKKEIEIPATPDKAKGKSTGLHQVQLSWKIDKTNYNSLTLKGYNVYCDGKKVATLNELKDEMTATVKDVGAGYCKFAIEAIYTDKQGKEMLSPRSNPEVIVVPEDYAFPLFDDFEKGSLNTNYWTKNKEYGDDVDTEWVVAAEIGHNNTIGVYTGASTFKPYATSMVSRPLDAANASKVKCSFLLLCVEEDAKEGKEIDLTKDTLSVEYTVDGGKSWQVAKEWTVEQLPKLEGILTVDLTKHVAGKVFQIRFRRHGLGTVGYYFYLDNIMIGSGDNVDAPKGFTGKVTDNQLFLMWKNSRNGYSLNYLSEPEAPGYTIGNEGKELIGANKFTQSELAPYHGKYLTSVTGYINYYEEADEGKGIRATVVVFENGKLVCEQEMEGIKYNENTTQKLKQPIKIDSGKELIVGIKVHDYDTGQIPLTYESSQSYVTGKSDLYSEDNGKTWKTVWDFYEGDAQMGTCCWRITGNITEKPDDETVEEDKSLIGYNIFRNGVQLNNVCIPFEATRYIDKQPLDKAEYTVVAYYNDGRESLASTPYILDLTNSIAPLVDKSVLSIDKSAIKLNAKGTLRLYAVDGHFVAKSSKNIIPLGGIPSGIYIVLVEYNNQRFTQKIIINK